MSKARAIETLAEVIVSQGITSATLARLAAKECVRATLRGKHSSHTYRIGNAFVTLRKVHK